MAKKIVAPEKMNLDINNPDLDEGAKPIRVTQRGVAMIARAAYQAMVEAKDGVFDVARGLEWVLEDHKHLFEDPSLDRKEGWTVTGKFGKRDFRNPVPDEHGIYEVLHDPAESTFESGRGSEGKPTIKKGYQGQSELLQGRSRHEKREILNPIRLAENPKYRKQYEKLLGEAEEFDRAFPMGLTFRHSDIYKDFLWQNGILEGKEGAETQRLKRTVDVWDLIEESEDPGRVRPTELFLTDKAATAFQAGKFDANYNVSLDKKGKGRPPDSPIQAIEKPTQQIAITGTTPKPAGLEIKKGDLPYYTKPEGRELIPNMLVTNSKRLLKLLNQGERIDSQDIMTRWNFEPLLADTIMKDLQQEGIIKQIQGKSYEYEVNKDALWKLDRPNIKWIHGLTTNQLIYLQAAKKEDTNIIGSTAPSAISTAVPPSTPKFNPESPVRYGPDNTRLSAVGALNIPKYKIDLLNQGFTRAVKEYAESDKKAGQKDFIQMWWGQSKKVAELLGQDLAQQDFRNGRDVAFVNENLVADGSGSKATVKSFITDDDVPVRMKPAKGVVKDVVPFVPDPVNPGTMLIPRNAHATSLSPDADKERINLSLKNALDNSKNPGIRFKGLGLPFGVDALIGATIAGGATLLNPKASWADVGEAALEGANPFDIGATEAGRGSEYSAAQAKLDREIAAEDALAEELGYDLGERRAKTFGDVYYDAPRPVHLRDILTPEEINELTDPIRKREGKTEKSFLDYR